MAETTRMNISIPVELKREMDGIEQSVNWSSLAAEAFRRKLQEIASTRRVKNVKDVIARLKAARDDEGTEDFAEGKDQGEAWAREEATAKQLQRLAESNPLQLFNGQPDSFGWAGVFYIIVQGKGFNDRSTLRDFWEFILSDDRDRIYDEDFARGFVTGALEVWDAVKDEV